MLKRYVNPMDCERGNDGRCAVCGVALPENLHRNCPAKRRGSRAPSSTAMAQTQADREARQSERQAAREACRQRVAEAVIASGVSREEWDAWIDKRGWPIGCGDRESNWLARVGRRFGNKTRLTAKGVLKAAR